MMSNLCHCPDKIPLFLFLKVLMCCGTIAMTTVHIIVYNYKEGEGIVSG